MDTSALNESRIDNIVVPVEVESVMLEEPTSGSAVQSAVVSRVISETSPIIISETVNKSLVSEHEDNGNDDNDEDDDDESEYEYEDEDETNFGGFLAPELQQPARIEDYTEPSKEAVTMSLRAERETTGGKRRLASDLYKIMIRDTAEAGFSLEPSSPDNMDKWAIKLFQFDEDSNLHKDMVVLGLEHVELEMSFPDQYPFEPPFVRVVRPKFKKQSGFVMNGALCMELLTRDGWNPVNDIESVIVSIRSLLVVGDGRLQAAAEIPTTQREAILAKAIDKKRERDDDDSDDEPAQKVSKKASGSYSMAEAQAAYSHLSDYHKKKGWDNSGWWRKKG
jgi:ubiquitin-conjugating enzyme E2 Q